MLCDQQWPCDYTAITRSLVEHNACVEPPGEQSPLYQFIKNSQLESAKIVLAHNANIHRIAKPEPIFPRSPYEWACCVVKTPGSFPYFASQLTAEQKTALATVIIQYDCPTAIEALIRLSQWSTSNNQLPQLPSEVVDYIMHYIIPGDKKTRTTRLMAMKKRPYVSKRIGIRDVNVNSE